MTTALAPAQPGAAAGRATLVPLAVREARRFSRNPLFLFAVVMTMWVAWSRAGAAVTEIDEANGYPAVFLGGFGMMAAYWLTRSMRASEPVAGVTPVTRPARTAALCWVAIVPFLCGILALLGFLRTYPLGDAAYGPFSPSARVAVLVGQIVVPSLGGPLLGVALGRWVRFPGAAFVLCAIAVLVALLRGAEGRVRARIIRALAITGAAAVILLVLAATGGFTYAVTA
jgi:hypothetical protein